MSQLNIIFIKYNIYLFFNDKEWNKNKNLQINLAKLKKNPFLSVIAIKLKFCHCEAI